MESASTGQNPSTERQAMTQYEAILKHLRKHGSATVRDLLKYTNYPSARIFEMTSISDTVLATKGGKYADLERIERQWTIRNGKWVRLYKLVRVK
jgi:hypothetical protein